LKIAQIKRKKSGIAYLAISLFYFGLFSILFAVISIDVQAYVSDLKPRTLPPLPAMGGVNSVITDPTFGSRILRVTDAHTMDCQYPAYQNRDETTPSSAESQAWNADSTLFYSDFSGLIIPFKFDPATFSVSRIGDPNQQFCGLTISGIGASEPEFSRVDPNILYGTNATTNIVQYSFLTHQISNVFDVATAVPQIFPEFSDVSASASDRLAVAGSLVTQQWHGSDDWTQVVVWDKATGQTAVFDLAQQAIKNFGVTSFHPMGPNAPPLGLVYGSNIHNVRLDATGRYAIISDQTPCGGIAGGGGTLWDIEAGTVDCLRGGSWTGHKASGYGFNVSGGPGPGDYGPQVTLTNYATPASYTNLLPPNPNPPWVGGFIDHMSWNDAQPGGMIPVVGSNYASSKTVGASIPAGTGSGEIAAIATDGSNQVWRYAYSRSFLDNNWYSYPRGNVSPDGRYYMFNSNWDETLGLNESSQPRVDIFIVELSTAPFSPAPNPPTTPVVTPSALSQIQVYPNPWRSDKHGGKQITFAQLVVGGTIKIFTTSGHKVKEIPVTGTSMLWNLNNDKGDKVASGIYLYLITDGQGNKAKGKLAVIK